MRNRSRTIGLLILACVLATSAILKIAFATRSIAVLIDRGRLLIVVVGNSGKEFEDPGVQAVGIHICPIELLPAWGGSSNARYLSVPVLYPVVLAAVALCGVTRARPQASNACAKCGYDLSGLEETHLCPECGRRGGTEND